MDHRRQEVGGELQRLREEHNRAPDVDAQALAAWFRAGEKGTRPEPTEPKLKRQIEDKQREHDALLQAADAVLAEKVGYVERHRKRLASEVAKKKEEKRERYEALVAELARAREALRAARSDEVWAQLYPSRAAQAAPPAPLAGGRRVAGIEPRLRPEQVVELLKRDAEFLFTALTQEQAEELGLNKRQDEATWIETPEGIECDRKDRREQLEAYKRTWGVYPA